MPRQGGQPPVHVHAPAGSCPAFACRMGLPAALLPPLRPRACMRLATGAAKLGFCADGEVGCTARDARLRTCTHLLPRPSCLSECAHTHRLDVQVHHGFLAAFNAVAAQETGEDDLASKALKLAGSCPVPITRWGCWACCTG